MAGFRAVSHMLRFGSGSGLWNASGCAFYMHGRGTDFRFLQRAAQMLRQTGADFGSQVEGGGNFDGHVVVHVQLQLLHMKQGGDVTGQRIADLFPIPDSFDGKGDVIRHGEENVPVDLFEDPFSFL